MKQVQLKKLSVISAATLALCSVLILGLASSCDEKSNTQDNEIEFTETYSGSFETAPAATDSNEDGKPANVGQFMGTSTFGSVSIQSLNEFEVALENSNCDEGGNRIHIGAGTFHQAFFKRRAYFRLLG